MQDPTEKHFGDVGILDKYNNNNNNNNCKFVLFRSIIYCFIVVYTKELTAIYERFMSDLRYLLHGAQRGAT